MNSRKFFSVYNPDYKMGSKSVTCRTQWWRSQFNLNLHHQCFQGAQYWPILLSWFLIYFHQPDKNKTAARKTSIRRGEARRGLLQYFYRQFWIESEASSRLSIPPSLFQLPYYHLNSGCNHSPAPATHNLKSADAWKLSYQTLSSPG